MEFPDKRRFVKKGFEYLSMATSGKLLSGSKPHKNLLTYGPLLLHRTLQRG
ncbi:hypothetical protein X777_04769 [Ooceraea biroi]|uniref:Uncharacterized protein n=1 Tax=Ooceraea biroi TaxID=2015173 RepID=A0A026WI16_OOCBI|nr:hypothetical protein X777_04769 [Ooceraea biroi]